MTISEFRKAVREAYPHVKVRVRTVSFEDLARSSGKCLSIDGALSAAEISQINEWARLADILPDSNIRFFPETA